ncbi:MAG: bifunctional homocysteine S-methyltransferase/methylenetetrahydrofolate reductase [Candidatus Latescibacterota bacterium]
MNKNFLEELQERILLADGAMGTMLYAKGIYINTCFDELNLTRPSLVSEIHREYVTAGAEIIETNTFGANRYKLSAHGIEDRVKEINEAGAELARTSAGKNAFIAGAIGPLGKPLRPLGKISKAQAFAAFQEQATALAPIVDLFILETIHGLEEMEIAIAALQSVSRLPIIAQITFTDEGETLAGESPQQVAAGFEKFNVPCIGVNCTIGPQPMLEVIKKLSPITTRKISAQPNAGSPRLVENRFIYLSSPEYMAEYAKKFIKSGVSIVGGCCGTTPDHIKAMSSAIRALQPVHVRVQETIKVPPKEHIIAEIPFVERSRLAASIYNKFVISVEIDPPRGLDPANALKAAKLMREHGVDAINIADGPRASARMSPMALATLIERDVNIETLLHYCCRDRNLLGMQADLIGAHALGLRNLLIVTGDPPKLGDYPSATAVFDVDSIGLVRIVRNLNRGLDLASAPLGLATSFTIGVGVNPGAMDLDTEIERFYEKVNAGAEYALTQPVYEASLLESFLSRTKDINIPLLVGILPLSSFKNAEFLHNEVPGMQIPQKIRKQMSQAASGEDARELGIRIAIEALRDCATLPSIHGAYIMPPFGRFEAVLKILEGIRKS